MALTPRTISAYAPWNWSGLPRSESCPSVEASVRRISSFCRPCTTDADVVDGLLHLLVIALVGLGDQFVDLAVGDLRQNAIAFADGQQNRVQHGVDTAHDIGVSAAELVGLAALGELSVSRRVGQPHQFLLQALDDRADVVDSLFHLLVIALVGLGDQLVDLAVRDLRQDAVALADGQQDRIEHVVDALQHLAMGALKLVHLAALVEATLARCFDQTQDLLRHAAASRGWLLRSVTGAGARRRGAFRNGCPPLPEVAAESYRLLCEPLVTLSFGN